MKSLKCMVQIFREKFREIKFHEKFREIKFHEKFRENEVPYV